LHDSNANLDDVMPDFTRRFGGHYAGTGLRDLCASLHDFYRARQASRLQRETFEAAHLPEPVLPPRAAWEKLLRNEVDYVPISQIEGRVAATLALVYPPGIGLILPGERYGAQASPVLDYLRLVEEASNHFPGFENEIQGIYRETDAEGRIVLHTYVLAEG
ncbi:MAG: amino acid decarboxylase, partial [Gammaproteobacteria bacterium]